jgi:hypothetical protein
MERGRKGKPARAGETTASTRDRSRRCSSCWTRHGGGSGWRKPFVDNERYDVIVDATRRLWPVQVKASEARHHNGFAGEGVLEDKREAFALYQRPD